MKHKREKSICRPGLLAILLVVSGLSGISTHQARADENTAIALEEAFTSVAEKAFPAVVVVTNKRTERNLVHPGQQLPPEFRYFFGIPEPDRKYREKRNSRPVPQPVGGGSGIIVRDTGYILTNYHVIKGSDALEVKLQDGRIFDSDRDENAVKIVGTDKETDLAILQIGNGELRNLPTLEFCDPEKIKVGQWAIAVGAPFNLDHSVAVGVVSQKGRHDVGMTTFRNFIQTDASINPGNSGGPLLNIKGEIIGVNEFIMTGGGMSRGSVGVGFAVEAGLAREVTDSLIKHGDVIRPFLGIAMQAMTEDLKKEFGVERGVLISEVMENEPAEESGIEPGDVILKVGEKRVRTPSDVQFEVLKYDPGDKIDLTVSRDGKKKEFAVTATKRNGEEDVDSGGDVWQGRDLLERLGIALDDSEEGVFVVGVESGGPAAGADLRRGDLVLEVNREEVKSVRDVRRALKNTKRSIAVFYIERRGNRFFVPIPLPDEE